MYDRVVLETYGESSMEIELTERNLSSTKEEYISPLRKDDKIGYRIAKRTLDITCSLLALIVLSPVFAITALAIWLEDGGNPIFAQTRVGKDGKFFRMYKFRSMCVDAEKKLKDLQDKNETDGPTFKMTHDPRVTKVGAFIRKTSIDELPQLINILNGSMSIVGPRPPLGNEVIQYNDYQMQRLSVKPGLTCFWQCSGRSDICFDEWMDLDIKYIKEHSFWLDIKLIAKTIPAVLLNRGAY